MSDQVTSGSQRERLLDSLTETIGSTSRLAEILEASADQRAKAELSLLADEMQGFLWEEALSALRDAHRWQTLAGNRENFDSELNGLLKNIAKIRRLESGVPERAAHRPTTRTVRDAEIYRLREDKKLSFGQIGQQLDVTDKEAGAAYHRFVANDRKRLRDLLDTLLDIHEALVQLGRIAPLPPFTPTT